MITLYHIVAGALLAKVPYSDMESCRKWLDQMKAADQFRSYCTDGTNTYHARPKVAETPEAETPVPAPVVEQHKPPLCSDYYEWKRRESRGLSVQDMLDCGGDAPLRMDNSVDGKGEV